MWLQCRNSPACINTFLHVLEWGAKPPIPTDVKNSKCPIPPPPPGRRAERTGIAPPWGGGIMHFELFYIRWNEEEKKEKLSRASRDF